ELGVNLAISLHAVTDELRNTLVPLNKKYPIAELLDACRNYPGSSNARRITFEYVMLKGINDSPAEAKELVRRLKGIPAKVNLIPFTPGPGAPLQRLAENHNKGFPRLGFHRRLLGAGKTPARPRHLRRRRPAKTRRRAPPPHRACAGAAAARLTAD